MSEQKPPRETNERGLHSVWGLTKAFFPDEAGMIGNFLAILELALFTHLVGIASVSRIHLGNAFYSVNHIILSVIWHMILLMLVQASMEDDVAVGLWIWVFFLPFVAISRWVLSNLLSLRVPITEREQSQYRGISILVWVTYLPLPKPITGLFSSNALERFIEPAIWVGLAALMSVFDTSLAIYCLFTAGALLWLNNTARNALALEQQRLRDAQIIAQAINPHSRTGADTTPIHKVKSTPLSGDKRRDGTARRRNIRVTGADQSLDTAAAPTTPAGSHVNDFREDVMTVLGQHGMHSTTPTEPESDSVP